MIVEALESYAKVTSPWLQAWNAANAMSMSATRIAVGQMELAALTTRFLNQRLSAYASFDGRVEPLVRRLDKLTERYAESYAESYAAQVRALYTSWSDILIEDRPLTEAVSLATGREEGRREERWDGKAEGRREERPEQRRDAAAH
jgi:hypothetical protein